VREGEKDQIRFLAETRGVEIAEDEAREPAQMREDLVEPLPSQPLGSDHAELELGMHGEEAKRLRSHVATRPRDRDA